jgi:PLD-like domain
VIQLVVRRCLATSSDALRVALTLPGVSIRFIDLRWFHSKIFIFDSGHAIVGSANLTSAGIRSNHETGTLIWELSNAVQLKKEFEYLWNNADCHDLDEAAIAELEAIAAQSQEYRTALDQLELQGLRSRRKVTAPNDAGSRPGVGFTGNNRTPHSTATSVVHGIPLKIFASNELVKILRLEKGGRLSLREGKKRLEKFYGVEDTGNDIGGAALWLSTRQLIFAAREEPADYVLTEKGWTIDPSRKA